MFMLNLLFDFAEANPEGRFTGDRGGTPLLKSKNWLKIPTPDFPGPVNSETAAWKDLGEAGTLLIPSRTTKHVIAVRIAPVPMTVFATPPNIDLVIAFGAPVRARQKFSSPFDINTVSGPLTSFHFSGLMNTPPGGGNPTAWFFKLGAIARDSGDENITHRYEFGLGAMITSGGVSRAYGEDPEMDIGF